MQFEENVLSWMKQMTDRLEKLEKRVGMSVIQESYTVAEAAERLERAPWTVRQWCNKGLANATKNNDEHWRISHDELCRLKKDGPLRAKKEPSDDRRAA